jgi:signal transduction histidine kinase
LDQNAIARRLANRWRLPDWVATVIGNLNLPLASARPLVSGLDLFAVVQLALCEAESRGRSMSLALGADRAALLQELNLNASDIASMQGLPVSPIGISSIDQNPHAVPLLVNLLTMAVETRGRTGSALVARLEDRLDDLHRAVGDIGNEGVRRARDERLAALAELAAGAGHEINNPLAVISSSAQRLFRTEPEPDRGHALQTIIRQTQRIAGIVRDLMQFARPPKPSPRRVRAEELLLAVRDDLAPTALERKVRLEITPSDSNIFLRCDFSQLRHALGALARNGVEAAGVDGWVRLGYTEFDEEFVLLFIEDSGPGLSESALQHCFDPFFCGRSAGRGRGLGLPTAWQLVRQNGGDVRYDVTPGGPTRFVVTVQRSIALEFLDRQSA